MRARGLFLVALIAAGLLALRAASGLSPWRPRVSVPRLGVSEIVFGAVTVLVVALGADWRI
jgi:hypothetical protein